MLFRPQALEYQQFGHAQGHVLLRSPAMLWFFSSAAILLSIGLVWLGCTTHYTQRERVFGRLTYDKLMSNLQANQAGIFQKTLVTEGSSVKLGQPLFVIGAPQKLERPISAARAAVAPEKYEPSAAWYIVAPHDGNLSKLIIRPGQAVTIGQTLAQLLPADIKLQAELYVSANALLTLRVGDKINLRYTAFPYQKFGQHVAIIREISKSATEIGDSGKPERKYRVLLEPQQVNINYYGKLLDLMPDMEVEADILLSEKNVVEWIFEPLLALRGKT